MMRIPKPPKRERTRKTADYAPRTTPCRWNCSNSLDKKEPAQGLKRPCEEMRPATISEAPSEDLDAVHATLLEETLRLENKEAATISEAPSEDLDEAYASLLEETLLEKKEAQEASRELATWRATSWTLHWMGDSGLIMRERLLIFASDDSSWLYTVCLPVPSMGPQN